MRTTKCFKFSAAHRLECESLHGHNYRAEISIEGPVDRKAGKVTGLEKVFSHVEDFDRACILNSSDPLVKYFKRAKVKPPFESQRLIELEGEPTPENIVRQIMLEGFIKILTKFPQIMKVEIRVWETEDSSATYFWDRRTLKK